MNEEYRVGRVSLNITADFNEKVKDTAAEASAPTYLNIGYFILQDIMKGLNLKKFFFKETPEIVKLPMIALLFYDFLFMPESWLPALNSPRGIT